MKRLFAFIIVICIITAAVPLSASAENTYSDVAAAVENLRKGMIDRESEIAVYLKTDTAPTEESVKEIFELALKETGASTAGDYLHWHIGQYGIGGTYSIKNGYYYCDFIFTVDYYTTAAQEEELTKAVNELLDSFGFTSDTADITKLKTIYDYICANVTYDFDNLADPNHKLKYTAYAALINKTAVCQGYSNLLYRLLHEVGINNRIVTGISDGGAHAWNIVELDGIYYNVDSTWDAGLSEYDFFLKCGEHFEDHLRNSEYTDGAFSAAHPMTDECYAFSECDETGHDMGDWYTVTEATETENGEKRRDCSRCDHFESATIPALGDREVTLGDINDNGSVDKYDYIAVKRAVMGTLNLDKAQQKAADINGNGAVDKYDYVLVKRHVMGTYVIAA